MSYDYMYSYTREFTQDLNNWNINYPERINAKNNSVLLAYEIQAKLPDKKFIVYAGYDQDPSIVAISFEVELNEAEQSLLDTVISNHKNNVPDKYGVWYQDTFVDDPGNPGNAYLFDTEEAAQQFIIDDELDGAVVKGVVVL
jgi:hypothetical protein